MIAKVLINLPVLSVLISLLAGVLYSWLLYRRHQFDTGPKWLAPALAAARFIVVALMVWLLFAPSIRRNKTEIQKPALVILQDNSSSVTNKTDEAARDEYWEKLESLRKDLSEDFDVKSNLFAEGLSDWKKPGYSGKETDINEALNQLSERYSGQPIGAVILASDGIYNKGNSPLYNQLLKVAPVYTIPLGDTTPQKDARIAALRYNEIVYSGDKMAMQVEVSAYGMQGQNAVLQVTGPNGFRHSQGIAISQEDHYWRGEIITEALRPGVQKFVVTISNLKGDKVPANNTDVAYVEVLDGREKILLLYNSPHPDVKAIRAVAEQNHNLTFEASDVANFRGNVNDYSLVILHGLPSASGMPNNVLASNAPLFFIVSAQTDLSKLNEMQQLVKIMAGKSSMQEVQAIVNPRYAKFNIDPGLLGQVRELPPLLSPVGTFTTKNPADALFTQQIGQVSTDFPLLSLGESGTRKVGILAAEGIWRWRMYDFLLHGNHSAFDNLFGKIVQYLTVKDDKRPFRLRLPKAVFAENEPVSMDAELYNESFELVNDPDVSLVITGPEGKRYSFTMDKTSNAYTLMAGIFPVGDYTATASVTRSGKSYKASRSFSVKPLVVESIRLEADHKLLAAMSKESGGGMYSANDLQQLVDQLRNEDKLKPVLYDRITTSPLVDYKWILGLFILLLAGEWFARKMSGGY